jgi:FKBP-type peptidyl-prolyl cis-trans isomerase
MKFLKTLALSTIILTSLNITAAEETLNSYTMGAVVGEQLLEKMNTTEKLGLTVDKRDFMIGVLDSLTGKISITEEDKQIIINSLKEKEYEIKALPVGVKTFENSNVTYKIIKEGEGNLPSNSDKVKIKYTGYLDNGDTFTEETAIISMQQASDTGMGVAQILKTMPSGSTYEFNVPHYLNDYKKETLNKALSSWVKDKPLLEKDSYFNHVIPHQLAYHGSAEKNMKPYSSLTFKIEVLDII